jgi:hypothetical protein
VTLTVGVATLVLTAPIMRPNAWMGFLVSPEGRLKYQSNEGGPLMVTNPNQVIVTLEDCVGLWVHTSCAHHRNLPEIRAEDESPRVGAVQLADQLASSFDGSRNGWHRISLADVRAFIEQTTT